MEKKFRFKTNLKCNGCVSKITPFLNSTRDIKDWVVDLKHPDKVLTVTLQTGDTRSVRKAFEGAGYKIEEID